MKIETKYNIGDVVRYEYTSSGNDRRELALGVITSIYIDSDKLLYYFSRDSRMAGVTEEHITGKVEVTDADQI